MTGAEWSARAVAILRGEDIESCPDCDGCTDRATDDAASPWWEWAALPPPSNLAVVMGLVQKVPCTTCHGTGRRVVT